MLKQLLIILAFALLSNGSKSFCKIPETTIGRLYSPSDLFMKNSFRVYA